MLMFEANIASKQQVGLVHITDKNLFFGSVFVWAAGRSKVPRDVGTVDELSVRSQFV